MYSLDQIRCFVAVAEELHFGRAAERLRMTQPPLSRQIQKLEHSIGVTLLDRNNRSVALTAAGRAFLTEARRLLVTADNAPDLARRIARGASGTVRIGFTAVSAFGVLGPLLDTIDANLPDVDIVLRELVTSEQIGALSRAEIDLGLARPPLDRGEFETTLLYREPLVLVAHEHHPLVQQSDPIDIDQLHGVEIVMYSPVQARYFYDLTTSVFADVRPRFTQYVTQIHTVIALVAAGRGAALVPKSAENLGMAAVRYVPLTGIDPSPVELHAVWRREADNPALRRIIDHMSEIDLDQPPGLDAGTPAIE
ncbi:LysR family transcriptional regulator [Spelaeicoccus albus]|uniref:DNA-binding transcriptional LysR family regulator n=1 Tax=Spelaeicoccus albus TaxID=1280376 RepID=A0A7Z0A945_9MICO|nr:LysR family transcriptional regulator [Spelaeicoccus albus]NYI66682.1 DNA-binding transcriptional LysR family regulator [Spelaeicoccus albus]